MGVDDLRERAAQHDPRISAVPDARLKLCLAELEAAEVAEGAEAAEEGGEAAAAEGEAGGARGAVRRATDSQAPTKRHC